MLLVFHHTQNPFAEKADNAKGENGNESDGPNVGPQKKGKADAEAGGESSGYHGDLTDGFRWLAKHPIPRRIKMPFKAEK